MSEYLSQNKNNVLSKLIFSARSGTLDLKVLNEWNYNDKTCVMCKSFEENFDHFMKCYSYGQTELKVLHTEIFGNNHEDQFEIAKGIKKKRIQIRRRKLDEVGLPPTLAPLLQDTTVELQ